MKSAYTTGQWLDDGDTIFSNGGHIIAGMVSGRFHPDPDMRIAERKANARLLSSSPQLLQCLLQVLADHMNGKEFNHEYVLEMVRMASPETALEYGKAMGRSA